MVSFRIGVAVIALFLSSCKAHESAAVTGHAAGSDSAPIVRPPEEEDSLTGFHPGFLELKRIEARDYSISYFSKYLFPGGKLHHDSEYYFKGDYLAVVLKSGHLTDTIQPEGYNRSLEAMRDLTDSFGVRPVFIQLVLGGEDLYEDYFIGYRHGHLHVLFSIGDTEGNAVELHRSGDSVFHGYGFGVNALTNAVERNHRVSFDLRTYNVSHPEPEEQYIGFKTAALVAFRANRVVDGMSTGSLVQVNVGDSVVIDTFYRVRQKVRLLTRDSVRVEIKLGTAREKLWRLPAPG
jgi:hypothetical protein